MLSAKIVISPKTKNTRRGDHVCHLTMNGYKRDGADEQSKTPARLWLVLAGGEKCAMNNYLLVPRDRCVLHLYFVRERLRKKKTLKDSHTMSF